MKKLMSRILIILSLTAGFAGIGQIAVADNNKAEAYTTTVRSHLVCGGSWGRYAYMEQWGYVDFSWSEEFWLGKRDYKYFISSTRTPTLDYKCRTWYA